MNNLFILVWVVMILPVALGFIYAQGVVNRDKSKPSPPIFIGAILSPLWPLELAFLGLFYGGKFAYGLGDGRGMRINTLVSEAKEIVAQRDDQYAQVFKLAAEGDVEGLRALISGDDVRRQLAALETETKQDQEPEILNLDGDVVPNPSLGMTPHTARYSESTWTLADGEVWR